MICDNPSHKDDWREQHFHEFAERPYIQKRRRSDLFIILKVHKARGFPRLRRSDRVPHSSYNFGVRAWILEFYAAFVSMARVCFRSVSVCHHTEDGPCEITFHAALGHLTFNL